MGPVYRSRFRFPAPIDTNLDLEVEIEGAGFQLVHQGGIEHRLLSKTIGNAMTDDC